MVGIQGYLLKLNGDCYRNTGYGVYRMWPFQIG